MKTLNYSQLRQRYERQTVCLAAQCHLSTPLVGGMPADEKSLRLYCQHQMNLEGEALDEAVKRIMEDEVPEEVRGDETDELTEEQVYGVNVIRRDEHGPWLGDWMVKANLKAAASGIGLFVHKRGTKRDFAELGEVQPAGVSFNADHPRRIYLRNPTGDGPAHTSFEYFRGSVQTPQGRKSIVNRAEVVEQGARFDWNFRFYNNKTTEDDAADVAALGMIIGLGSCKAFERGKYAVTRLTIDWPNGKGKAA